METLGIIYGTQKGTLILTSTHVSRAVRCTLCRVAFYSFLWVLTQRPQSSSFLGLPYRILYMTPKRNYFRASG